jgi:FixJ family two-component response regulator
MTATLDKLNAPSVTEIDSRGEGATMFACDELWLRDSEGYKEPPSGASLVSIVDDDVSVRRSTRRLLHSSGLRAEAFATADEFLLSGWMTETACLLLDVRMPGLDGLELQRRLRESHRLIPIIFLSARAREEEQRRALQAGAVNFLRKPVSKEVLLRAIRAAIESPINDQKEDL